MIGDVDDNFLDLKALVYGSEMSQASHVRANKLLAEIRLSLSQHSQTEARLYEPYLVDYERILSERKAGHWTPCARASGVDAKRRNKDRSYWRNDSRKCSRDGIGAELAACLSLCPGYLGEWMHRSKNLEMPNPGQDLLGAWVGYEKDFEIKSTASYDADRLGIMFIRQPSNMRNLTPDRDIHDSIYVLFTGESGIYCGRCWADRRLFCAKGVRNPPPLPTDGFPTFGNHHSKFVTYGTIVQELGLKPADVTLVNSCPTA